MHPVLKELFGVFNIDSVTNVDGGTPGSETNFFRDSDTKTSAAAPQKCCRQGFHGKAFTKSKSR
jgi:hypothetical protein